jgi:hypothetical protein
MRGSRSGRHPAGAPVTLNVRPLASSQMTSPASVLSLLPRVRVSSTRRRLALSHVLAATAICHSAVTRNIHPAVAGAVTAPRALIGGFVHGFESALLLSSICSALADPLCKGARFSLRSSRPARQVVRGGLTSRSTGPAGSCFHLRSSSARRAGYLYR